MMMMMAWWWWWWWWWGWWGWWCCWWITIIIIIIIIIIILILIIIIIMIMILLQREHDSCIAPWQDDHLLMSRSSLVAIGRCLRDFLDTWRCLKQLKSFEGGDWARWQEHVTCQIGCRNTLTFSILLLLDKNCEHVIVGRWSVKTQGPWRRSLNSCSFPGAPWWDTETTRLPSSSLECKDGDVQMSTSKIPCWPGKLLPVSPLCFWTHKSVVKLFECLRYAFVSLAAYVWALDLYLHP